MSKIKLKATSIFNIPFETYGQDFLFIVNDNEFRTSRFLSDLLSPKISLIHSSDPTIDTFTINTQHEGNFSHILNLIKFHEYEVNSNEFQFILEVISQLGDRNFNITINNKSNQLTKDNIIGIIQEYEQLGIISNEYGSKEIEFISNHFNTLIEEHREEIKKFKISTLISILEQPKLALRDEDQLLSFINELYESDKKFSCLYEKVLFKNVSAKAIRKFIEIFDCNEINEFVWEAISRRLACEVTRSNNNNENERNYEKRHNEENEGNILTFSHTEGNEFNGIIKYLTNKTSGNIHCNGTIKLTTNSFGSSNPPKNLLDFNQDNYFMTRNFNDTSAWVCFDFKNMQIEISQYSIKSHVNGPGAAHIKNWVLETSDDMENWIKIDEHSNYDGLNGSKITKTFDVSKRSFSRYCRIRLTGEYFGCQIHVLALHSIEFYGRLKVP